MVSRAPGAASAVLVGRLRVLVICLLGLFSTEDSPSWPSVICAPQGDSPRLELTLPQRNIEPEKESFIDYCPL